VYDANVRFLNHDTYTDIITFDYVEGNLVSGDILISVDRVMDNARMLSVSFERELHRVVIHGVLHLLGFKDKSDADAAVMRQKEEESLSLLDAISRG
jgi:rRNA maturation RNase YbeY